jgi:transposase-like protein
VECRGGLPMANQRKKYPPEMKVEILREHLKNKVSVSEVCEKYGIHPNMFYKWEKQLFEGAIELFSSDRKATAKEMAEVTKMKQKVQKKDEVISWLTEENIKLKKPLGISDKVMG